MDAKTFGQILDIQLGYTNWAFNANVAGLSDADALHQLNPGGNCLNWVVGHLLNARGGAVAMLGQACPFAADKYDRYRRGSAPITEAAGTVPLTEMAADFAATAAPMKAGLKALTTGLLAAKAPFSPTNDEQETVGSLLAGLLFHEAYHIGQLAVQRRLTGAAGAVK